MDTGRLTNEEAMYIDARVVDVVHAQTVGRNLFPVFTLPHAGFMTVRGYKRTGMSAARISLYGGGGSKDRTEKASFDITVPVIEKEFDIDWREFEASRGVGIPIDTQDAENAAIKVAEEEDHLLITGEHTAGSGVPAFPALGVEGLATATGRNSQASGGAWPATALTDLSNAIGKLEEDGHVRAGAYAAVLRSSWAAKLRGLVSNTAVKWIEVIKDLFPAGIYVSDSLYTSAGLKTNALVLELAQENFEMVVGKDVEVRKKEDVRGNLECVVREVVAPRIKRPTSICEITGLT